MSHHSTAIPSYTKSIFASTVCLLTSRPVIFWASRRCGALILRTVRKVTCGTRCVLLLYLGSSVVPLPTPITQTEYAMATLIHLGLGDFAEEFLGEDGIHDLGNMLSLESIVYIGFSDLDLWFEGTQEVRHLPTSR